MPRLTRSKPTPTSLQPSASSAKIRSGSAQPRKEVDNEKYAFRCFLLRLGFIGSDYKAERKILLKEPLRQLQLEERRSGKGGSSMRMIRLTSLNALRSRYPAGTRVELLRMDDVQAPPIGTKGTVTGVIMR
jgi:hypothetical protein